VSYFEQIQVFWFWLLAVIPCFIAMPADYPASEPLPEPADGMDESVTERVTAIS
jgi:hypothetical protein